MSWYPPEKAEIENEKLVDENKNELQQQQRKTFDTSEQGIIWGCNEAPFIRRWSVMLFYKFNGQVSKNTQNRKHHNYTQD